MGSIPRCVCISMRASSFPRLVVHEATIKSPMSHFDLVSAVLTDTRWKDT